MFTARGSTCMVCGVDLWDVDRYVSAGAVVICQSCVDALKRRHGRCGRDRGDRGAAPRSSATGARASPDDEAAARDRESLRPDI